MLLKGPAAARALAAPDPAVRLYVLAGPDESASRAMAASLGAAMGAEATRVDLSAETLRADPAALPDHAAAISLFGGPTWISVHLPTGSGDELLPACEALLGAPAAGNPVVVIASGMTGRSRLAKLAESHALAVTVISYVPDARDAARLAQDIAGTHGLTLGPRVAEAIAAATGGDRGLIAQEVAKLALYCDAAPDTPGRADIDAWQSIGAGLADDDVAGAVNIILEGRLSDLPHLFETLDATGTGGIGLVRALARRAIDLAALRVDVDGGLSPARAVETKGRGIFWKEKSHVTTQLRVWNGAAIVRLVERLHALERTIKASSDTATLLMRADLLDITRAAAIAGR